MKSLREILDEVPYKALLSLPVHEARRENTLNELAKLGVRAEWVKPVAIGDVDWKMLPSAFQRSPRYGSHAQTMLELFDQALTRGVKTFMHIEDDLAMHPEICARLARIMVPDDWKFIYFGGRAYRGMKTAGEGIVRPGAVSDLHMVILQSGMIGRMRRALLDAKSWAHWCDRRIGSLHAEFPAYLCRPNLAWQAPHPWGDAGNGPAGSNYNADGTVKAGKGR